jgi:hypothetical protein
VNVRHQHVLQHDAVVGVVGDDDIAADLLHMLLHCCEMSEDRVIDLQVVLSGREVRDGVVTEVHGAVGAGEVERVVAAEWSRSCWLAEEGAKDRRPKIVRICNRSYSRASSRLIASFF